MIRHRAPTVLAVVLAVSVVWPHGASRGLHLHVLEQYACPGRTITVELDASRPVRTIRAGFAGEEPVRVDLETPARKHSIELEVPVATPPRRGPGRSAGPATLSVQVEAWTSDGESLRAAAIVKPGRIDVLEECPQAATGQDGGSRRMG